MTRLAKLVRKKALLSAGLLVGAAALVGGPGELRAAPPSESRLSPIVVAVRKSRPAVVNIHGEKTVSSRDVRGQQGEVSRRVNGMGTGVIIDERGYIVTNHHVVEGVRKITVTTADEESYTARLISHDAKTDLAIIKIDADQPLPVIETGTSSDLMPGETVVAVGNAFGYQHTVTRGIVSALHRTVQVSDTQSYEDLIQTDASINPGNSGGPLLNIDGQMIGVNVAVRAGAQGIGFAIPVDKAFEVAGKLLSAERIDKVWHGVEAANAGIGEGMTVAKVAGESPAATAGLQPGDVISQVGDVAVRRTLDFERALLGKAVGDAVELQVDRSNEQLSLNLVLASAASAKHKAADPAWESLGLELRPLEPSEFSRFKTKYRGGLMVVDVRPGGPAAVAAEAIRPGDVLVGMHIWETVSLDNVRYILERPNFADLQPIKFYILRDKKPYFGHLTVAHRKSSQQ